jgi:nucleoside-diphosphate-sugar epimerase
MKVLLTGASGFFGGFVFPRLLAEGHRVGVLLRRSSKPWRLAQRIEAASSIVGDLAEPDSYRNALASFAPEAVIHLAWGGVNNRDRDDQHQVDNLTGTLTLLKQAASCGAGHFIGIGSQAEYGPRSRIIDEDAPTRPTTIYGATKLATCLLTQQLCRTSGIRFAWLRIFSAYGPGDNPSWLIPSITLSLLRGERPALTRGEQLWDFLHVEDVAAAICAVASATTATGVFNVGSGATATIRSIIEHLRDMASPGAPLGFGALPYRPDQVMHLQADITRLTSATGWKPKIPLTDGLEQTVGWFRDHRERYN